MNNIVSLKYMAYSYKATLTKEDYCWIKVHVNGNLLSKVVNAQNCGLIFAQVQLVSLFNGSNSATGCVRTSTTIASKVITEIKIAMQESGHDPADFTAQLNAVKTIMSGNTNIVTDLQRYPSIDLSDLSTGIGSDKYRICSNNSAYWPGTASFSDMSNNMKNALSSAGFFTGLPEQIKSARHPDGWHLAINLNFTKDEAPSDGQCADITSGGSVLWRYKHGVTSGAKPANVSNRVTSYYVNVYDVPPPATSAHGACTTGLIMYDNYTGTKLKAALVEVLDLIESDSPGSLSESERQNCISEFNSSYGRSSLFSALNNAGVEDNTIHGYKNMEQAVEFCCSTNNSYLDKGGNIPIPAPNIKDCSYISISWDYDSNSIILTVNTTPTVPEPEPETTDLKVRWKAASGSDAFSGPVKLINSSIGLATSYLQENTNQSVTVQGTIDASDVLSESDWSSASSYNLKIDSVVIESGVITVYLLYIDPNRVLTVRKVTTTGSEFYKQDRNVLIGQVVSESSFYQQTNNLIKKVLVRYEVKSGGSVVDSGTVSTSMPTFSVSTTIKHDTEISFIYEEIEQLHLTIKQVCENIIPFTRTIETGWFDKVAGFSKSSPVGMNYLGTDYDLLFVRVLNKAGNEIDKETANYASALHTYSFGGIPKGEYVVEFVYEVRPKFYLTNLVTDTAYEVWPTTGDPYTKNRICDIYYTVLNIDESLLTFDVKSKNGLIDPMSVLRSYTPGHGHLDWNLFNGCKMRDSSGMLYDDLTFTVKYKKNSMIYLNQTVRIHFIENPLLELSFANVQYILDKDAFGDEVRDIAYSISINKNTYIKDAEIDVVSSLRDNSLNGMNNKTKAIVLKDSAFPDYVLFARKDVGLDIEDIKNRLRLTQNLEWKSSRTDTLYKSNEKTTDSNGIAVGPYLTNIHMDKTYILNKIDYVSHLDYDSNPFLESVFTRVTYTNPESIKTDVDKGCKPSLPNENLVGHQDQIPVNCKDIEGITKFDFKLFWTYIDNTFKKYDGSFANNILFERLYIRDSYYLGFYINIDKLDITKEEDGLVSTAINRIYPYIDETKTRLRISNITDGFNIYDSGDKIRPSVYAEDFYYNQEDLYINKEYEFLFEATPYKGFGVPIRSATTMIEKRLLLCEERIDDLGMSVDFDMDNLEYIIKGKAVAHFNGYDNLTLTLEMKDKTGKLLHKEDVSYTAIRTGIYLNIDYEARVHILDELVDYDLKNISDIKIIYEYDK